MLETKTKLCGKPWIILVRELEAGEKYHDIRRAKNIKSVS